MACTKTNHACACTRAESAHTGPHKCACGQEWLGRRTTNADEHAVLMDLREVTEGEAGRVAEAVQEHLDLCQMIRELFGTNHTVAHAAIKSFKFSCRVHAERLGITITEYLDDMPQEVRGMLLGACVGGIMAAAGEVAYIVEEGDDDGE
jgi:hypothetical protein